MLIIAAATLGPDPEDMIADLFEECTHLQVYDGDTEKLVEVIERNGKSDVQLGQIGPAGREQIRHARRPDAVHSP